jgi:hypothetical protein
MHWITQYFVLTDFLASSQPLQRQYVRRNWRGGLSVAEIRECGHRINHRAVNVGFVAEDNAGSAIRFGFTSQYDSTSLCGRLTHWQSVSDTCPGNGSAFPSIKHHDILTFYSPVVTVCTAQWSLHVPNIGHYKYGQFNIQQYLVLPAQCICVFYVDLRTHSNYFPIQH